jgi:hypothetical protein
MGLSALGPAMVLGMLGYGSSARMLSYLLYPLGFIVVILGRSQLFTENTLYPVALVLAEKREFAGQCRRSALLRAPRLRHLGNRSWHRRSPQSARPACSGSSVGHYLLVGSYRWLDDRAGCLAGFRVALDHRICHGHLDADICSGPRRLCALHRLKLRNHGYGTHAPCPLERLWNVAVVCGTGEHLRRCRPGDDSGIRAGGLQPNSGAPH